jgi:hypothetical protein
MSYVLKSRLYKNKKGGNMQKFFVVLLLLLWNSLSIAQQASVSLEPDTDRPGNNYRNFDLEQPDVDFCLDACQKDPRCKAFTYVNPGVQGPKARCWLKDAVPPAKSSSCCISGVKTAGATQSQSRAPKPMIQGEIKMSPKSGSGTSETPSAGGQPTAQAGMGEEIRAKIPPASKHRVEKLNTRGDLINLLLSNPRTAPRLNQFASTMGMPAQQLATRSTSGKSVSGEPATSTSSSGSKNWDWETGVHFTPRSSEWEMEVYGVTIMQSKNEQYGLSDMYQRDELLLYGKPDDVRILFSIPMPPGIYVIKVEFIGQMLGVHDDLIYDCYGCGSCTGLFPVVDNKTFSDGMISSYIGQFEINNSNVATHSIRIPMNALIFPNILNFTGVFRGITLMRL